MKNIYLAIDLGATSGRAIIGYLDKKNLVTEEINRFPNEFTVQKGHLFWNIFSLYEEIVKSIKIATKKGYLISSLGIDTWGVDYALLDKDGFISGLPYAYRDKLTDKAITQFTEKVMSLEDLYKVAGIQVMKFNSIFQLFAQKQAKLASIKNAGTVLFMPDALSYLLTGKVSVEYTIASTSSLLNAVKRNWDYELLKKIGLQSALFPKIVKPGTIKGKLTVEIARHLNVKPFPIVAVASHDTASAVAAIPAKATEWAFLSLGTWSLMGFETKSPIKNKEAFQDSYTNEGGVNGTIRFLKNITGFWIIEQCIAAWEKQGNKITYEQIDREILNVPSFERFIDTDEPSFAQPGDMITLLTNYLNKTKQSIPASPFEWARCIFESLAMKYRITLEKLRKHAPFKIKVIHAIGGGARNSILCQMTANATQLPVIAGPVEATAMGNLLVQAYAMKELSSFQSIRQVVKKSTSTIDYKPVNKKEWDLQFEKFRKICSLD
ncbi:MAG: rhamnulokinase family protein [Chitinophagaceae bacterium]